MMKTLQLLYYNFYVITFYDKNIMFDRKNAITEKPCQSMLHDKAIPS